MKNKLYIIWEIIAIVIILVVSAINKSPYIQIIASICGVIYILGMAKEKRYSQIFGLINASIYGFLMYKEGAYGSAVYNVIYCVPMIIYTYFVWGEGKNAEKISRYETKERVYFAILLFVATVIATFTAYKIGIKFAVVDAATIIFGIFGMYAISKKKIEQWYAFTILNLVNISLWMYKCIESMSNMPMVIMYVVYIINNLYGAYTWNKELKKR